MLVRFKATDDPAVQVFQPARGVARRAGRALKRWDLRRRVVRAAPTAAFAMARSEIGAELVRHLPPADVVNIQFGWDFVDYPEVLSRLPGDAHLHEMRALRATLAPPVFSTDRVANLPWILGNGGDSFVFGYAYQSMLAAKPQKFTEGTIADQLREGRFGTVVLSDINASYHPSAEELAAFQAAGGKVVGGN